jgi:hypothetical protein
MSSEAHLQRNILLKCCQKATRLFRNNVAKGWVGTLVLRATRPMTITLQRGDIVLRNARRLHSGLMRGSHDLIGWTRHTITPADVGRTVAIFTSLEVKYGKGRPTREQIIWGKAVEHAGGITGFAYSVEQAKQIIGEQ